MMSGPQCDLRLSGCDFQFWEMVVHWFGFTVPESASCQSDDFGLRHVTGGQVQAKVVTAGHSSQEQQMEIRYLAIHVLYLSNTIKA